MAIETKMLFESRVKRQLGETFTVVDTNKIMEILSDCLSDFDLTLVERPCQGLDDLLGTYLNTMKIQGRSTKTVTRYEYIIRRMLQTVGIKSQEISVYHLRNYLASEKARGVSDSTLEGTRQIFSAYFNWLQREGLIATNPTANLGAIKKKKKVKIAYSDVDIERLKRQCSTVRDRAIVCFLLSTACRVSEMVQLNRDDVDLNSLECTVLGKGNKERTVYLDSVTAMLLAEYLNSRKDNNKALFIGLRGERLLPNGVRIMLKKLGLKAGVEKVHPHKFRRTRATNLIKHGMPIQEVAAILGHEKIDTTMEYVVMDKSSIKNAYQKYA